MLFAMGLQTTLHFFFFFFFSDAWIERLVPPRLWPRNLYSNLEELAEKLQDDKSNQIKWISPFFKYIYIYNRLILANSHIFIAKQFNKTQFIYSTVWGETKAATIENDSPDYQKKTG